MLDTIAIHGHDIIDLVVSYPDGTVRTSVRGKRKGEIDFLEFG